MNITSTKTDWIPYKIPATPNVSQKSYGGTLRTMDPYVISAMSGSSSEKNPSQFLEWSQLPINDIFARIQAIEDRLNAASISSSCSGGTVNVTLRL